MLSCIGMSTYLSDIKLFFLFFFFFFFFYFLYIVYSDKPVIPSQ